MAAIPEEAVATADRLLADVVAADNRTWDTTLVPLDQISDELRRADGRAELRAHTDRLVEIATEFQRDLAEHEDPLVVTREDLAGLPDANRPLLARPCACGRRWLNCTVRRRGRTTSWSR